LLWRYHFQQAKGNSFALTFCISTHRITPDSVVVPSNQREQYRIMFLILIHPLKINCDAATFSCERRILSAERWMTGSSLNIKPNQLLFAG